MLKDLLRRGTPPNLLNRERPDVARDPVALAPAATDPSAEFAEYALLSASLGISHPSIDGDLQIERFKAFLREKDWPVFSLASVIAYMDKKAEEESAEKAGWHWRPLRAKDHLRDISFGREASAISYGNSMMVGSLSQISTAAAQQQAAVYAGVVRTAASDHYRGPTKSNNDRWGNVFSMPVDVAASAEPYNKLIPLHALRKVAEIEANYKGDVAFFVCDYAPAPHIEYPDPFLMAVVNNAALAKGVGRFVIDFWDEPGFGLTEQLG